MATGLPHLMLATCEMDLRRYHCRPALSGRGLIPRICSWLLTFSALIVTLGTMQSWVVAEDAPPATAKKPAEDRPPARGPTKLIRVPLPLTGDSRVATSIRRFVEKQAAERLAAGKQNAALTPRPTLVLEFTTELSEAGTGSTFGQAYDLATLLTGPELADIETYAYIPKTIKGHAVLVALACKNIAIAPDAEIGDAGIDEKGPISVAIRKAYDEVASRRRTVASALAINMLDRNAEVYQVAVLGQGTQFVVGASELATLKKTETLTDETRLPQPGLYSGQSISEKGYFTVCLAKDRAALARELGVDADKLRPDSFADRQWVARQIVVDQTITAAVADETSRMIDEQVHSGDVNMIILRLNSAGGSLADSAKLATYLASLDSNKVVTVAYIEEKASADAVLIALACDQIAMGPLAILGGPGLYEPSKDELPPLVGVVQELMKAKNRSWSLPAALLDRQLKVNRYSSPRTGAVDYFCREELSKLGGVWTEGEVIASGNDRLKLTAEQAEKVELSVATVKDFEEFKQRFGLTSNPQTVAVNWAQSLLRELASPALTWLLILIGFVGLYIELQAPGTGVGGFISLVAFMLYFWANHLNGTAGWLTVLMFLAGLGCILLEIFVLPGFAVFGLGGGMMVIASLVLASQTVVLPQNEYQVLQLRNSLLSVCGAGAAFLLTAIVLRQYLPRAPMFNKIVLAGPSAAEREVLHARESLVDFGHLLGKTGEALTSLAPSGKARFGDNRVDVLSDGEFIDRGTPVEVFEVRGNKILVRRV